MSRRPATAKPGDMFVLLVPDVSETEQITAWQSVLQAHFGGTLTNPVHVTCQRFSCQDDQQAVQLIQHLKTLLAGSGKVPITGVGLSVMYWTFRDNYILKCKIKETDALFNLGETINAALQQVGIQSHYPWIVSDLVTVLQEITVQHIDPVMDILPLPHNLFLGCQIIISRVTETNEYEVIESFSLETA